MILPNEYDIFMEISNKYHLSTPDHNKLAKLLHNIEQRVFGEGLDAGIDSGIEIEIERGYEKAYNEYHKGEISD